MPHLVATLIYLSQIYLYYIRGDMSPLNMLKMNDIIIKYIAIYILSIFNISAQSFSNYNVLLV